MCAVGTHTKVAKGHCPLDCSGRGTCLAGFCHCQPGFWGYGCARSKAYQSDGALRGCHVVRPAMCRARWCTCVRGPIPASHVFKA
jgi:hypothetical protein